VKSWSYIPSNLCFSKALEIIKAVDAFGGECLSALGSRLFYCGDELYLKAGLEIPDWDYYEGFPQFENGWVCCAHLKTNSCMLSTILSFFRASPRRKNRILCRNRPRRGNFIDKTASNCE
jgi:hypothetical protein